MEFFNIIYLSHIGFRLSSYMLVSFFVLMSLFNSDVRGLVFLAILLVETAIMVSIGRALAPIFPDVEPSGICNTLNLTATGRLSGPVPLNLNTFAFTFGYLIYIIAKNKLEETPNGVMIMIFFISFIVAHIIWLFTYGCANIFMLIATTVVGTGFGALFSYMISSAGNENLQFFGQLTGAEVCKRATNEKFKCTTMYTM
jgi:hypothetical protein